MLLLYDSTNPETADRIGAYLPYLKNVTRKEFMNSNIDFNVRFMVNLKMKLIFLILILL